MPIKDQILADLKQAMLQKDEVARDALRMVKADVMNKEVELGRTLEDPEILALLQRAVKSRRESVDQYQAGGRADAADQELREIEVIQRYLPRTLSEEELREEVTSLIAELGLEGKKDLGKVMAALKQKHGAAVDGKLASRIAASLLA